MITIGELLLDASMQVKHIYICMNDTVDRPINFVQQTHKETTEQSIWIRQWLHHVAVGCHYDLA